MNPTIKQALRMIDIICPLTVWSTGVFIPYDGSGRVDIEPGYDTDMLKAKLDSEVQAQTNSNVVFAIIKPRILDKDGTYRLEYLCKCWRQLMDAISRLPENIRYLSRYYDIKPMQMIGDLSYFVDIDREKPLADYIGFGNRIRSTCTEVAPYMASARYIRFLLACSELPIVLRVKATSHDTLWLEALEYVDNDGSVTQRIQDELHEMAVNTERYSVYALASYRYAHLFSSAVSVVRIVSYNVPYDDVGRGYEPDDDPDSLWNLQGDMLPRRDLW